MSACEERSRSQTLWYAGLPAGAGREDGATKTTLPPSPDVDALVPVVAEATSTVTVLARGPNGLAPAGTASPGVGSGSGGRAEGGGELHHERANRHARRGRRRDGDARSEPSSPAHTILIRLKSLDRTASIRALITPDAVCSRAVAVTTTPAASAAAVVAGPTLTTTGGKRSRPAPAR